MSNYNNKASTESYDSYWDTMSHIDNINSVLRILIITQLYERAYNHDASKLQSPEKEMYDKYIPLLRTAKYGTPEYMKIRNDMQKDGLDHHFQVNRHHPEHFKNKVNDMNLIDFIEMVADWFAASLRSDTSFMDGLAGNVKKYELPEMIVNIIKNTYNDCFKGFESLAKGNHEDEYVRDLKLGVYESHRLHNISDQERDQLLAILDKMDSESE